MEKQAREELVQLCHTVLENQDDLNLTDMLTRVQMLYEKLLVLNYLRAQQASSQAAVDKEEPIAETLKPGPEPARETEVEKTAVMASPKMPEQSQVKPPQKASVNSKLGMGSINIGLNDRISFVKNLFGGQQEDFNRVLSQLNTFESLAEAENFIEQMVKPDYDWHQKEEYEMRFLELVRHRFGEE